MNLPIGPSGILRRGADLLGPNLTKKAHDSRQMWSVDLPLLSVCDVKHISHKNKTVGGFV